jgi:hypothetical protein
LNTYVKFELASPSKPVVLIPVKVDGRGPYNFVLDTGAVICTISAQLGETLGIKPSSTKELPFIPEGEQIRKSVQLGQVDLEIGAVRLPSVQVAMTDLSSLSQMADRELSGIIGYNALKDFIVTIDYPKNQIQLSRKYA